MDEKYTPVTGPDDTPQPTAPGHRDVVAKREVLDEQMVDYEREALMDMKKEVMDRLIRQDAGRDDKFDLNMIVTSTPYHDSHGQWLQCHLFDVTDDFDPFRKLYQGRLFFCPHFTPFIFHLKNIFANWKSLIKSPPFPCSFPELHNSIAPIQVILLV